MKSKITTFLILFFLFQSCSTQVDNPPPKEDNSVVVYENPNQSNNTATDVISDTSVSIEIGGEEIELTEIEEGVETIINVTQTIVEAGNDMLEAKRRKDSIKLSQREKMFVYQLGIPFKNTKQLLEAYENFSDKEGVCVFKKSHKEYLLIKYQSKSEEDLDKELDDYRSDYAAGVIGEIKKIDLVRECGKRKSPSIKGKLKSRKKNIKLDCLICK